MNYYTSVVALCWLALAVLGILVWENGRLPRKEKRHFYLSCILIAFAALAEWLGVRFSGNTDIPGWALQAVKCADYILTPVAGAALAMHFRKTGILRKLINAVLIFNTAFQLLSAFTGWTVRINAENVYSHGPLYAVYIAVYALIMFLVVAEYVSYGQNFRNHNKTSIYAILMLVLAGTLIQEITGGECRTVYIGLTLGTILLYIHFSEFSQIMSDEKIQEQKVVITTDVLTGAASRYAYTRALSKIVSAEAVPENLTVFSIDINGLKITNDTLGHAAGDELICAAADCIKKTFAENGTCYRTGGDEFIVLAEMDAEKARNMLSVLKRNAEAWRGSRVERMYLAAGFACAADHRDLSGEKLVAVADEAMYKDKAEYYRSTETGGRI